MQPLFQSMLVGLPALIFSSVVVAAPYTYSIDSGVAVGTEFNTAAGCIGVSPYSIEWANRFVTAPGAEMITHISVAFGEGAKDNLNGTAVTVILYDDPNNDGSPDDAQEISRGTGAVANYNTDIFNSYAIDTAFVSGSFFVAVQIDAPGTSAPARFDNVGGLGESWVSASCTSGNWIQFADGDANLVTWMIRAEGNYEPASLQSIPQFMLATLDDPSPSTSATIVANEDISGMSCQFVDKDTWAPLPDGNISMTGSTVVAGSLDSGATAEFNFACDASIAASEWVRYSCNTDQGEFSMETQCTVTASQVVPWFNGLTAVVGDADPTVEVEFTALNRPLTISSCDFSRASSMISLNAGTMPASLALGASATLQFACDASAVASESFLSYSCETSEGPTNAWLTCDITPPPPVVASPDPVAMSATTGIGTTSTVDFTAQGTKVENIQYCGFYDDQTNSISPASISLINGLIPSELDPAETASLTFACGSAASGNEEAFYGCNSNSGIFSVQLSCDVQPATPAPVTVSALPQYMLGILGDANPSATGSVQANTELANPSCGFIDPNTRLPIIAGKISLISEGLPSPFSAGSTANLTFDCDASSTGFASAEYYCSSNQGDFGLPVNCGLLGSEVEPWVSSLEAISGNPEPSVDVVFSAKNVDLDLSCSMTSTLGIAKVVSGSMPTTLEVGSPVTMTFGCDTSNPGSEIWASYSCTGPQGDTNAFINCQIDPRQAVNPWPEKASISAVTGTGPATMDVVMKADVVVNGITGCGFYDDSFTAQPVSIISLQSASFLPTMNALEEVTLSFACSDTAAGYERANYGCLHDEGFFGVSVECDVSDPPTETPVVVSPPAIMKASSGDANPTAVATVTATGDMTVSGCGFADKETFTLIPTPTHLSLIDGSIPSPDFNNGTSVELTFRCDTSTPGVEDIIYGCYVDPGIGFTMPVKCEVEESSCPGGNCGFMKGWRLAIPGRSD